ncbi:MAG TPA: GNAT family N-acetyltransferase [Anaerolineae bacterium]|nr:GNAT family N-acetyltransferase [Anaerolineae bacterium]
MQIDRIETLTQFDQLRASWDVVYHHDPQAHVFVSWLWLRGWFELTPYRWLVLAVRPGPGSPYVAFLPLVSRGPRLAGIQLFDLLTMGGQPLAPYTGFVCLPAYEPAALAGLAGYIQQELTWVNFRMSEVLDSRLKTFLQAFPRDRFTVETSPGMPSLFIPLPESWEQYLEASLSKNTRKKLRRHTRQLESLPGFRTTEIQATTAKADIDLLLSLWQQRWGPKPMAPWLDKIFHHCFKHNTLWLKILWDGSTPIAASVGMFDHCKKKFYGFIFGGNADYNDWSPGKVTLGYELQDAIAQGCQVYDFLAGADDYKFSLGAQERTTFNVIITPTDLPRRALNRGLFRLEHGGNILRSKLGKLKRVDRVKRLWFAGVTLIKRVQASTGLLNLLLAANELAEAGYLAY